MGKAEPREIDVIPAVANLVEARGGTIKSFTSYQDNVEMGWSLITPHRLHSDIPLLTSTGYLGQELAYVPAALAALDEGVATVITGQAVTSKLWPPILLRELVHPEKAQADLVSQVLEDLDALESIEIVDGTGHSKAGCAIINAAHEHPERFRSVTTWGGAGNSRHGFRSLVKRIPDVAREGWSERDLLYANFEPFLGDAAKVFVQYLLANSVRVAAEGIAVSRSYNKPSLKWLGSRMCLGAMVFEDDGFFKPAEVARKIAGIVDIFSELKGVGHLAPQTHPDKVIALQLEMIESYKQMVMGKAS